MEAGNASAGSLSAQWSPWSGVRPAILRNTLGLAIFSAAYAVAYHYGMAFDSSLSAPFWFPDSVLLCALLCVRARWWWVLLLVILPIRMFTSIGPTLPAWFVAAVYINDCAKAVLAAYLLKRFMRDPLRFNSLRDLGIYGAFVLLLVPALSALGGAAARVGLGHDFWASAEQWFLGNTMAALIVTPLLFYWVVSPPRPVGMRPARALEAATILLGLVVTLFLAFQPTNGPQDFTQWRHYVPLAFIAWAALRFRMHGATLAVAVMSAFAVDAAIDRSGSFANLEPVQVAERLQHFLLLRAAPLYLAAVLLEQWSRVSESLRESERRFRTMADHTPVLMWMANARGNCEFVNRAWLEFTGRRFEPGFDYEASIHPDDLPSAHRNYTQHIESRLPFAFEYRLRHYSGEYRWVFDHGVPRYGENGIFLGYIGSALDVTERRRQEAALQRSEARYREVVESQTGYVCRLLPDSTLTFVNSACCQFLGRSREELMGRKLMELLPASAQHAAGEALLRALAGAAASWECEFAHADGSRGWQQWQFHAISTSPEGQREVQAVGQDITDRKSAEESGRRLAHASRFAAVGELTAMVAHQINQPLCAILNNAEAAELMLQKADPPLDELREILSDIRKDDLRADAAIRSIRSLLHRREYQPRVVRLADIFEHVFKLLQGDALYRRVRLKVDETRDLPAVSGDPSQIEQVLVILIVNAMDAMKDTPEAAREVVVSARNAGNGFVEVSVRDRGHGIAEKNIPQLFDSFFTTKSDGMGLGLSIARSMIEVHGGTIGAENAPQGGAVFRFSVKVAATAPR